MSSTNKTEYLGLNQWLGSDRPQRIDFVDDNSLIDEAIKLHHSNSSIHVTGDEKTKINQPFVIQSYGGTGTEALTVTLSISPQLVIIFSKGTPFLQTDSSGNTIINACIVARSNGNSGGATLSGNTVTVQQSSVASSGVKYNLNKLNGQYCIVAFR